MRKTDMKYKSEDSIVAFIDILGASDAMKKDPEGALNAVHDAYDNALSVFSFICGKIKKPPKINIFSDNIVISYSCSSQRVKQSFYIVVILCAVIQEKLLEYKILTRGGIAKGDFFTDDIMVWGEALVSAYEIEKSISIYPRIVIHPKLIGELEILTNKVDEINKQIIPWIYQDVDGLCYVDYFSDFKLIKNPLLLLCIFLEDNEGRMSEQVDNIKNIQKIIWHSNYLKRKLCEIGIPDGQTDNVTEND